MNREQLFNDKKQLGKQIQVTKDFDEKNMLISKCRKIKDQIKLLEPMVEKGGSISNTPNIPKIKKSYVDCSIICDDCECTFFANSKLYCENCYPKYKNNAIEIVRKDTSTIYNIDQEDLIISELNQIIANIRLDLHGVATIIDPTHIFPKSDTICIISFVGKNSLTRKKAKTEIQERINSGQVKIGFLNFVRKTKKKEKNTNNVGTKAFINRELKFIGRKCLFVDDSIDHIEAVNKLKYITAIHFTSNDSNKLISLIEKF